eukprot:jgi/Hompol1/1337/HPOL_003246-RA
MSTSTIHKMLVPVDVDVDVDSIECLEYPLQPLDMRCTPDPLPRDFRLDDQYVSAKELDAAALYDSGVELSDREIMFEKSLTDVIRGLRANKRSEEAFVAAAIDEIRTELRKNDLDIKTNAISKLCLFHTMGYDMAWASFHIIEVMSSPKLAQKRVGYQAAALCFKQDTDVLMLCTNLIKKDLTSNSYQDGAVAMHALAQIVTPDLGRDLHTDLITTLNHSKPYMRKRAIIVLYRVFLKYPEALRVAFPRLKERLDDSDPSVVSAAVNVICELARKNPRSYLPLAPQLYSLLTTSSNNWMLIKIIKLFAALTPLEPRLKPKLIPPIIKIIKTTPAMSLIYESVHTLIVGGMIEPEKQNTHNGESESAQDDQIALLCVNKLKAFLEDSDQNLKYLGLYALSKLLILRPSSVGQHRQIVLKCLNDQDYSIRMRALDLVTNMVNASNLFSIVKHLIMNLVPKKEDGSGKKRRRSTTAMTSQQEASYRNQVAQRIIDVCSKDTYTNITNFEWYLSVLVDLSYCPGIDVGMALAMQFIEICVRVKEIVPLAVATLSKMLADTQLIESAASETNNSAVLYGAAWVVGEYCEYLASPRDTLDSMLMPQIDLLAPTLHAVYLQNILKVFTYWVRGKLDSNTGAATAVAAAPVGYLADEFLAVAQRIVDRFTFFTTSPDLEVQDRASTMIEILKLVITEAGDASSFAGQTCMLDMLPLLFQGEFNPVAPKAQTRVPVPEGLDLDAWIYEPEPPEPAPPAVPDSMYSTDSLAFDGRSDLPDKNGKHREHPFYLPTGSSRNSVKYAHLGGDVSYNAPDDIDSIPIVELSLDPIRNSSDNNAKSRSLSPIRIGDNLSMFANQRQFQTQTSTIGSLVAPTPRQYKLKAEEDVPASSSSQEAAAAKTGGSTMSDAIARNTPFGLTQEELEDLRYRDPDRFAVMSVDLTDAYNPMPQNTARASTLSASTSASALHSTELSASAGVPAAYDPLPDVKPKKKKKKKPANNGKHREHPFYLPTGSSRNSVKYAHLGGDVSYNAPDDIDSIPIVELSLDPIRNSSDNNAKSRSLSPIRIGDNLSMFANQRQFQTQTSTIGSLVAPTPRQYKLKAEEDVPASSSSQEAAAAKTGGSTMSDAIARNTPFGLTQEELEDLRYRDPDRFAVMSVDLTDAYNPMPQNTARASTLSASTSASALHSTELSASAGVPAAYDPLPDVKPKKKKKKKPANVAADTTHEVDGAKSAAPTSPIKKKKKKIKAPIELADNPAVSSSTDEVELIASAPVAVYRDDRVQIEYVWYHDHSPTQVPFTQLQLPITVQVTLIPLDVSQLQDSSIVGFDLDAIGDLTAERIGTLSFLVHGTAKRAAGTQVFDSVSWSVEFSYTFHTDPPQTQTTPKTRVDLQLPVSINLLPPTHAIPSRLMTPAAFLDLVTIDPATHFPFSSSIQLVLPPPPAAAAPIDPATRFHRCATHIANHLALHIVEMHQTPTRAASLYNQSILAAAQHSLSPIHVAGLVKERVPITNTTTNASLVDPQQSDPASNNLKQQQQQQQQQQQILLQAATGPL